MPSFTDRHGRVIQIQVDDYEALAFCEGRRVGAVTSTGLIEISRGNYLPAKVTGMHVDRDYQSAGIGLELLHQLSNELGCLQPADKNIGIGNQNALTDEGMRLTRRAQELGYVFEFEDEQRPLDWDAD